MAQIMPPSQAVKSPSLTPTHVTHIVEVDLVPLSTSQVPSQDPSPLQNLAPLQDLPPPQNLATHAQDQNGSLKLHQADHVDLSEPVNNSADSNKLQQTNLTDAVCVERPSHDSQPEDEVNIIFILFFSFVLIASH